MTELYLIFFGLALLLFLGIVAYSVMRQKKARPDSSGKQHGQNYVDPLFAELEQREKGQTTDDAKTASKTDPALAEVKQASVGTAESESPLDVANKAAELVSNSTASTSSKQTEPSPSEAESPAVKSEPDSSVVKKVEPTLVATKPKTINEPPQLDAAQGILTELVARVKNPDPIEQKELLKLFRNHDFKFHRKVHIYGLNELTDLWRDIEFELPSARFVELGVAIQLADRDGAMTNKELHDFQQMALDFSNKFDAPFEFSMDIDVAMKQAQILDQIGRRYDSMAVLNVVPRAKTGFRIADIESCARDLRMSTDKNGIFVKTRGHKQALTVLYRLACTDGSGHFGATSGSMTPVHDLVIYMNVPATETPDSVFQDMVKDANSLATWLDGKVVDRNGKVMTQRSYSVLLQQISDIAYSMQKDGITAGDAVSKKLF